MPKSPIHFPPYGVPNREDAGSTSLYDTFHSKNIPLDWTPPDPSADREQQWQTWFAGVIAKINEVLWPSWDPLQCDWKPAPSVEFMERLTRADFAVFAQMERERLNRGLDQAPETPNRGPAIRSHRQLFIIEDGRSLDGGPTVIDFASYYATYDAKLDKDNSAYVETLYFNSTPHKLHFIPYQVKALLQRPRPYQTALLLGHLYFTNELAQSGLTPSACSGHCLQGLTGIAGVYEYFHLSGFPLEEANLKCLRQYAADIGDRRVMAGVHYPSDNLCSWIILMHLADRVFKDPTAACFIWKAITKQSWVYDSMVRCQEAAEAYKPALDHLHSLAPANCADA
jgi:hypothetical protein